MEKYYFWGAIAIIVVFVIFLVKTNLRIDKLEQIISRNKRSNEMDISTTNKKVETSHSRLDNAATVIKELQRQIAADKKEISKLKNQLAVFTEIESDSARLNADDIYDEYISENIADVGKELDVEQSAAFDLMNNTNANLFITGKAGTGKSFLLKHFVQYTDKPVLVLAPTGIAALNANGATIHSVFGWYNLIDLSIDDLSKQNLKLKNEQKQVLIGAQTIIIDEISMVRADTFEKIDKILRIVNNKELPFGGKQIILFGDLFQLPPIADKEEIKYLKDTFGGIYFFNSEAYKYGEFDFLELSVNHRQKDDLIFFQILNNIREGNILESDLKTLNLQTNFDSDDLRRVVRLLPLKSEVEYINKNELEKIPAKEYDYKCEISFIKNDITFDIEKNMPISETLRLKKGALVMLVTNDANHRWVNGTLAIVSSLGENYIKVMINGREYEVLKALFSQKESAYENGRIIYKPVCEVIQYPVVLAYAITIHKSQGKTYKNIACDISNCFAPGQAYVALSRCVSINGLHLLKPVDKNILSVEKDVSDFYKSLKAKAHNYN